MYKHTLYILFKGNPIQKVKSMGIKHLAEVEVIIEHAEEPRTHADICAEYYVRTNTELNSSALHESLEHLLKEKKIKTTKMRIRGRDRTGYVRVK